jgi:hypothetical protein
MPLLVLAGCGDRKGDVDYEALELARQACIAADSAVDRLDDDLAGALEKIGEGIAKARAAADRDDAYLGIVAVAESLHDVMLEKENVAGIAKGYAALSRECEPVRRGDRPSPDGVVDA